MTASTIEKRMTAVETPGADSAAAATAPGGRKWCRIHAFELPPGKVLANQWRYGYAGFERACRRVLEEPAAISADSGRTAHQRYLDVLQLVRERDRDIAAAFDDPRRSRALSQLLTMHRRGWLEPEALDEFSSATREAITPLDGGST